MSPFSSPTKVASALPASLSIKVNFLMGLRQIWPEYIEEQNKQYTQEEPRLIFCYLFAEFIWVVFTSLGKKIKRMNNVTPSALLKEVGVCERSPGRKFMEREKSPAAVVNTYSTWRVRWIMYTEYFGLLMALTKRAPHHDARRRPVNIHNAILKHLDQAVTNCQHSAE